jgi:hypothetical protein
MKMKGHMIVFGIITVVLISGFSGCVGPLSTDYFNGEYAVTPYTIVSVTNINGQVDITGWDGDNVTVEAVKKSSFGTEALNNVNISVSQTENHLEIVARYTSQKILQASVDFTIKVPYNVIIETITTSNGAIQISKTKGDILASSSNGAILIDDVDGVVSATTSNGLIEVQETTGIGNLHTSNAAISAEIRSFQNNISIDTSNGAITIAINPSLNAMLDMTTSNAKVTFQGVSLDVSLLEETHVTGTLGMDGQRIDVHTSNANIHVSTLQA